MNMQKVILLLSTLLIFSGCFDKSEDKNETKKTPQAKIIKFPITLQTDSNQSISVNKANKGLSFSNVKNKAVLLSFMTTWCSPCKAEIPHLNTLQEKYKDKLQIIGVLLEDKNDKEIKKFIQEYKINYPVTKGKTNYELSKAVGDVQTVPFMILYNSKGEYATHYVGAILEEMLEVDIKKVVE